jgi:hypothetical protein
MSAAITSASETSAEVVRRALMDHARRRDRIAITFRGWRNGSKPIDCLAIGFVVAVQPLVLIAAISERDVSIIQLRDLLSIELLEPGSTDETEAKTS